MLFAMARFAWLGWGLPVALVFFLGLREIGTADFWWQWATGRHILENGIPTHDPWLTTPEPRPWIEMRWIYCAALYWTVENVGAWLAIVAAAALYAVGVGFALLSGGKAAPSWLAASGVAVATVIGRRLVVRPEVFTLLFLGITLWLIIRMRQKRLNPKWGVPLIGVTQIAWANTHALFALSTALCAMWLFTELLQKSDLRKVAFTATLVSAAAALINPYGLEGVLFPFLLLQELHVGAYRNNIIELRSPLAMGFSPSLFAHLLMAASVGWFAIKKRGDLFLLLACAATLYLSLTVVRNAPLFALCAAAYISTCDLRSHRVPAIAAGIAAAAMAYAFAIGTWTVEDRLGFTVARNRYALVAAKSIEGENGNVFNTLVEGSILIAQRQKAFCDPRLEVLPQDRFLEMMDIARLKKPLPDHFQVAFLAIDTPLAGKLVNDSAGWRLAGVDALGIALVRDPSVHIDKNITVTRARAAVDLNPPAFSLLSRAASPVPYRRLAVFFRNIGEQQAADEMLTLARRVYPTR